MSESYVELLVKRETPMKDKVLSGFVIACAAVFAVLFFLTSNILMLLGVIDWRIPVFYIGSFGVLVLITAAARGYDAPLQYMLQELFA